MDHLILRFPLHAALYEDNQFPHKIDRLEALAEKVAEEEMPNFRCCLLASAPAKEIKIVIYESFLLHLLSKGLLEYMAVL